MNKKRIASAIGLGVISMLTGAVFLAESGDEPSGHDYDAIIVLGCRVLPSGNPSFALDARARAGADLWKQKRAPKIFTTGGVGTHAPAEAVAAASVLTEEGVDASAILKEAKSTSTEENAKYVQQTLGPKARVLIVTDRYHTFRAKRVFLRYFDEVDAVGVDGRYPHVLWSATREFLAI